MNSLEAQLSPKCRDEAMDPKVAVGSPISHFQARYETRLSGNSAFSPHVSILIRIQVLISTWLEYTEWKGVSAVRIRFKAHQEILIESIVKPR